MPAHRHTQRASDWPLYHILRSQPQQCCNVCCNGDWSMHASQAEAVTAVGQEGLPSETCEGEQPRTGRHCLCKSAVSALPLLDGGPTPRTPTASGCCQDDFRKRFWLMIRSRVGASSNKPGRQKQVFQGLPEKATGPHNRAPNQAPRD